MAGKRKRAGIRLSEIRPRPVDWLWRGRLARGALTVIEGDPGLGKSTLTLDLVARVTAGLPMPGDQGGRSPEGAVIVGTEDSLESVVLPRLCAAGGDPARVIALGFDEQLTLPQDLDQIEDAVSNCKAGLLVIDPLLAFLPPSTDSYKDQHVRRALAPMAALTVRHGVSALLVRHLTKDRDCQNAKYRGGGSIGIAAAARTVLLAAEAPRDPERRVLVTVKNNLGPQAAGMCFRMGGDDIAARVEWLGETDLTADGVLGAHAERSSALSEAIRFLETELGSGPMPAREVLKRAREAGVSGRTLDRAKVGRVVSQKTSFDGAWMWHLSDGGQEIEDRQTAGGEGWRSSGVTGAEEAPL